MLLGPSRRLSPQHLLVLTLLVALAPAAHAEGGADASKTRPAAAAASKTSEAKPAAAKPVPAVEVPPRADAALGGDQARTRFLIGLEHAVEYQVFSLSNPNRVIVDLPVVALQLPADTGGHAVGLVNSFRAGASAPGKARIVIDVTAPVVVESSKVEQSSDGKARLVLDIVPVETVTRAASSASKKEFPAPYSLGAAGVQPPLPQPAVRPDVRAAKAFKPIIVIDPGHGGHDSGAEKNGTVEKDVVLAFSKMLRDKLEATGRYKVHMTRDTDEFIELGERVHIAERANANLFIAVHADYADGNSQARGATIYSLRESTANALKRSAKGDVSENLLSADEVETVKKASVDGDLSAVRGILADLAGRDIDLTHERTSVFSRTVIENMGTSTGLRSEPDQQAGFRVLKTAQFPSVLIELGYVTNKEDSDQLKSDIWRDKVSDSIMTAVDNYFSNQIARLPM